jgi:hypothetical protein
MTRKSKRELARAVDDLADGEPADEDGVAAPPVVYDTGEEYLDMDGEPVPTDNDGDPVSPAWSPTIVFPGEP